MHYHSNICFCYHSHWDDKMFDTRHMVVIEKQLRVKTYDSWKDSDVDWDNLIIHDKAIDQSERNMFVSMKNDPESKGDYSHWTDEQMDKMALRPYPSLKPEVMKWLEDNIEPPKSKRDYDDQPHGWCIGNVKYRLGGGRQGLTIWFYRRNDAMKFIKEWSFYKKPTTYFNYFIYDWRELNFDTMKLEKRDRD